MCNEIFVSITALLRNTTVNRVPAKPVHHRIIEHFSSIHLHNQSFINYTLTHLL